MKKGFLSLALFCCIQANSQSNDSLEAIESIRTINESWFSSVEGKALPVFRAKDLNGKTYTNTLVKDGKVTFLNFWFIACAPCIAEIPSLNRLYEQMKDSAGFQFFAITRESEEQVKKAIKKYSIQFPVLLTSQQEAQQLIFGRGYPTNMALDREGYVRSILTGGWQKPGNGFEAYWQQEIEMLRRK